MSSFGKDAASPKIGAFSQQWRAFGHWWRAFSHWWKDRWIVVGGSLGAAALLGVIMFLAGPVETSAPAGPAEATTAPRAAPEKAVTGPAAAAYAIPPEATKEISFPDPAPAERVAVAAPAPVETPGAKIEGRPAAGLAPDYSRGHRTARAGGRPGQAGRAPARTHSSPTDLASSRPAAAELPAQPGLPRENEPRRRLPLVDDQQRIPLLE